MLNAKMWSRLALVLAAAGLMAAPALAKVISGTQSVCLLGVDTYCSPDWENGTEVTTKVYKDCLTGIITLSAKGAVYNDCGCKVTFTNQGICLIDPCTGYEYLSTKDCEVISPPKPCKCKCSSCSTTAAAALVACYVPSHCSDEVTY